MYKTFIISTLCALAYGQEQISVPSTILIEDNYSPSVMGVNGKKTEKRSYSYDADRIRIEVKIEVPTSGPVQSLSIGIINDNEFQIKDIDIKDGIITEHGDAEIHITNKKFNTKYFPVECNAYYIYSNKYDFVAPIVFYPNNGKEPYLVGDAISDNLINLLRRKLLDHK